MKITSWKSHTSTQHQLISTPILHTRRFDTFYDIFLLSAKYGFSLMSLLFIQNIDLLFIVPYFYSANLNVFHWLFIEWFIQWDPRAAEQTCWF